MDDEAVVLLGAGAGALVGCPVLFLAGGAAVAGFGLVAATAGQSAGIGECLC